MKIPLNLPQGEPQNLFIDYLNSKLRTNAHVSSAGLREDGLFEWTFAGPFHINQEKIELIWKIIKSQDGELLYIEILLRDGNPLDAKWEKVISGFVTSVSLAALAEKRQSFFGRVFFNYIGVQLDGEYWLPGIRFAPLWPEDNQPHLTNAERVVSIDMVVNAIDDRDAWILSEERARRQAARLSLLLNIGLYRQSNEHRWVIPKIEGQPLDQSVRLQLGFWMKATNLDKMPKKGELCSLGKYNGSLTRNRMASELLSLPPEARRILRTVDSAAPEIIDAFDRGARLYQVAAVVGHQFPSVGLAYVIAAIEAISKADNSCKDLSMGKGFIEFVRKYVVSRENLDTLLEYMYGKVRSGHFHFGEFPLGEYTCQPFDDPFMDTDAIERFRTHLLCHEIGREAIVKWICSLLPEVSDQQVSNTENN